MFRTPSTNTNYAATYKTHEKNLDNLPMNWCRISETKTREGARASQVMSEVKHPKKSPWKNWFEQCFSVFMSVVTINISNQPLIKLGCIGQFPFCSFLSKQQSFWFFLDQSSSHSRIITNCSHSLYHWFLGHVNIWVSLHCATIQPTWMVHLEWSATLLLATILTRVTRMSRWKLESMAGINGL